jgi:hypothetical protein
VIGGGGRRARGRAGVAVAGAGRGGRGQPDARRAAAAAAARACGAPGRRSRMTWRMRTSSSTPPRRDGRAHEADLPVAGRPAAPARSSSTLSTTLCETPWLATARARGIEAHNGLSMLVFQAATAFGQWTGVDRRSMPCTRRPRRRASHQQFPDGSLNLSAEMPTKQSSQGRSPEDKNRGPSRNVGHIRTA